LVENIILHPNYFSSFRIFYIEKEYLKEFKKQSKVKTYNILYFQKKDKDFFGIFDNKESLKRLFNFGFWEEKLNVNTSDKNIKLLLKSLRNDFPMEFMDMIHCSKSKHDWSTTKQNNVRLVDIECKNCKTNLAISLKFFAGIQDHG